MIIRAYTKADKTTVLDLLALNTPQYFSPDEAQDLTHYLENEIELYYVLELEGQVIGCGGINFTEDKSEAIISWDILHPYHHGKGYGTKLMQHRMNKIHTFKEVQRIIVRTSQVVFPFYEKNGFQLLETKKDYWAPGFDLYLMEYHQK